MNSSMKIKRSLPPSPPTATKQVHNNHIYGFGRHTYEYNESATAVELQIPPTRSDSQAAERERELKAILDLAREKVSPRATKKKKRAVSPTSSVWTEEMVNKLIELHRAGLSFSEIGKELGVSKNSVAPKVRVLVEAEVLKPRMQEIMWTQEEMDRMFQMRAQGKTWGEIADVFGRKITACHMAYKREKERRKCLKE